MRMRRSKREEQKTDVWSDKKKIQRSEEKVRQSFMVCHFESHLLFIITSIVSFNGKNFFCKHYLIKLVLILIKLVQVFGSWFFRYSHPNPPCSVLEEYWDGCLRIQRTLLWGTRRNCSLLSSLSSCSYEGQGWVFRLLMQTLVSWHQKVVRKFLLGSLKCF